MITIRSFVIFCAATIATAAADTTAWRWEQAVDVTVPGMTQLDLPPATLDACQPSLADLRLIAPDGVETPWLLENTILPKISDIATTEFKATLEGRLTVLTARHVAGPIESVILKTPSRGFLKSVHVEGSRDGLTWQPIATGEVVFRQAGGAERLRLPVTPGDWPQLRLTLDDDRSPPVAFTGISVTPTATRAETEDHAVSITSRTETAGETRLTLGFPAKNLHLAELTLAIPDGVFSRQCTVSLEPTSTNGQPMTTRTIGSRTIYRVLGENGRPAASLTIPLHQRISADNLILTIANGDSPPLDIRGVSATRYPDRLLFFAGQAGSWKLLTGNRHATAPKYDLAPLRDEMTRARDHRISPGPLTTRPGYQAAPTLPGVEPAGSRIDLTAWGLRRAVHVSSPGVVRVELDTTALAHTSRSDLGDLRLIQNGKQIPWLLEPNPPVRTLPLQAKDDPDPKRPEVSRWKLTLPIAGLPVHDLTAESPDPLFTRRMRVINHGKDELGNPWTRVVGSATWTNSPGGGKDRQTLNIALNDMRLQDDMWIETDNGDNPPVRLQNIAVGYRAPSLVAKITDPAPVFLYYDNPLASPPVYDIGLVRAELLAADKQPATLGEEEVLKAGKRRGERTLNAGSPWLWAALALVVIVLLFIVAKMLPQDAGNTDS